MDVGLGRDRKVIQRQVKISCYLDKHAYIIQIQLSFKIKASKGNSVFNFKKFFTESKQHFFFFNRQKNGRKLLTFTSGHRLCSTWCFIWHLCRHRLSRTWWTQSKGRVLHQNQHVSARHSPAPQPLWGMGFQLSSLLCLCVRTVNRQTSLRINCNTIQLDVLPGRQAQKDPLRPESTNYIWWASAFDFTHFSASVNFKWEVWTGMEELLTLRYCWS